MPDLIAELETRKTYLKVSEFAGILDVTPRLVYKAIDQHKLPALKVGTAVRICPRAAAQWMRERTV